ncbi:MAG TPA: S41 family peptidase [Chitinophagaceae bacterium]|nr:S41 family peptidase [Chitinophagaceae bacterium]
MSKAQKKNLNISREGKVAHKTQLLFPDYKTVLYTSRSVIIYSSAQSEIESSRRAAAFFNSSKNLHAALLPDTLALHSDLKGANLYVFGTRANAWISRYYKLLPLSLTEKNVTTTKTYTGNNLRVVTLAPNPIDSSRVLLFFVAQQTNGLKDINALYDKNESSVQYSIFQADSLAEDGFLEYWGKKVVYLHRNPLTHRLFPIRELNEDVTYLLNELEAIHPNLYAYRSKTDFLKDLSIALKKINRPMTRKEFGHAVIPVVNSLKHGHTNLNLPWADLDDYKKKGGTFVPFNTHISNTRLLVANSLSKEIPPNAEIVSINGFSAQEILTRLRSYLNGEKDDFKDKTIGNLFHLLFWFLSKDPGVPYEVIFLDSTGNTMKIQTPGLRLSEISFHIPETRLSTPFEMNYINNSIAHLKYNLCTNYDEFKVFLNEHFQIISNKGIRNLIIDIRDNGGGNAGVNNLLFNYLTSKPYNNGEGSQWKVSYANLLRNPWLQDLIKQGKMGKDSLIFFEDKPLKPGLVQYPFQGKVFLLTSHTTFSSANMFASTFRCNKLGKVIGEETGGVTVSYGESYPVFLPNTKLVAGIATKKFIEACGIENARGVIPDIIVEDKRSDGPDKILSTCIEMINEK